MQRKQHSWLYPKLTSLCCKKWPVYNPTYLLSLILDFSEWLDSSRVMYECSRVVRWLDSSSGAVRWLLEESRAFPARELVTMAEPNQPQPSQRFMRSNPMMATKIPAQPYTSFPGVQNNENIFFANLRTVTYIYKKSATKNQ